MNKLPAILIIGCGIAVIIAVSVPVAKPIETGKIPAEAPVAMTQQEPMPGVINSLAPRNRLPDFRDFLNAIEREESHGNPNAVGKDGELGVYQIGRLYWIDGKGDDYETGVLDKDKCEQVMWNYWSRYCPEALQSLDYETLARIHVGGPRGESKECTKPYWRKKI